MFSGSVWKNIAVLGIVALISGIAVFTIHSITKGYIAKSETRYAKRFLFQVVPSINYTNDILTDTINIPKKYFSILGIESGEIHLVKINGKLISIIVPSIAHDGYSGKIKILVGINLDGSIVSVRVVSHQETPGLGDNMEVDKSDWILNFNKKSLKNLESKSWKVKKDGGYFDQFTGATITPNAIIKQVHETLKYYEMDKSRIIKELDVFNGIKVNNNFEGGN
jgi:electron transport complex protein RnfG